ncbi:MAG TPA: hypothetical protein VEC14_02595 [Reyranellaceae bacterium]|nr:hypothetical protein [Reyranellaceae bacterium]
MLILVAAVGVVGLILLPDVAWAVLIAVGVIAAGVYELTRRVRFARVRAAVRPDGRTIVGQVTTGALWALLIAAVAIWALVKIVARFE